VTVRPCPACGEHHAAGARWCPRCGEHLDAAPANAASGTPTAEPATATAEPATATAEPATVTADPATVAATPATDPARARDPSRRPAPRPAVAVVVALLVGGALAVVVAELRPEDVQRCVTSNGGATTEVTCLAWSADLGLSEEVAVELVGGRLLVTDPAGELASYRAGTERPSWTRSFAAPLTRHPGTAAGTVAVTSGEGSTFVELDGGRRLGGFEAPVQEAAIDEPWLFVTDGTELTARGVVGTPGGGATSTPGAARGLHRKA
jgi:hypothetical protein